MTRTRTTSRPIQFKLRVERLEALVMPTVDPTSFLVASGAAAGSPPLVKVYDGQTGQLVRDIMAYDPAFRGGVNVALWDLNNDNIPDVVTGPGIGGGPHIKAFDGQTGAVIANFMAYDSAFRGGASVAAGVLNGVNAIVTGAGQTGGPHVKVFDTAGDVQQSFMAFDLAFRGGVHVAIGDVRGDGQGAIVAAAGRDGGPHVKVFSAADRQIISEWMSYDMAFRGGVNVAVGDLDGDGFAEVIAGAGPGGGPHVRTFNGRDGTPLLSFMAGDESLRGGVSVASERMCGCPSGPLDILTVVGENGDAWIRSFDGENGEYITRTEATMPAAGPGMPTVTAGRGVRDPVEPCATVDHEYPYHGKGLSSRLTCSGPADIPPDCGPDELPQTNGNHGTSAPGLGAGGIRVADGIIRLPAPDIGSGGPIEPWGHKRTWTNGWEYDRGSYNGTGWSTSNMPSLLKMMDEDGYVVVGSAGSARFFDGTGPFTPRHYLQETLTHDSGANQFVFTDTLGNKIRFWDFTTNVPLNRRGQFQSFSDPAGNLVEVVDQTNNEKIEEVQSARTVGGTTITESYLYAYVPSGPNAGMISSITHRRKINAGSWSTVRSVEYTYYGTSESHGNVFDLKTAVVKDASSNAIDTYYYRYYTGEGGGYVHGMKLAFGPTSYERLKAVYGDPTTATHAQAAVYADHYFEYDSDRLVTLHTVQGEGCSTCTGGLGTYAYSYATSTNGAGYNSWKYKTVETLPDGHQNVYFMNGNGQVMLQVFREMAAGNPTGNNWITYYQYDAEGRLILTAEPSAVSGYDDDYASLIDDDGGNLEYIRDNAGLIHTTTFYTSNSGNETTPGAVDGYQQYTKIQRGESGTPVTQSLTDYYTRTVSSQSVHPVATSTVYRNTNQTGGQTTTYAYTWHSGTLQTEQMTVTLPTVTTAQNGPNSADVSYAVYDSLGRMAWTKDADGFITYTAYDQATGAVVKTIVDVDTAQTSDFANLPSGWTTPGGGGLHLITTMLVDNLGRTTKVTMPNGTVRYTVYKDHLQEVRQYDWNTSSGEPIGPITMYRQDRARHYAETLTFSAAFNGSWPDPPDGTESIGVVYSLNRSIVNDAGQTIASDQYFTLNGTSYSQTTATRGSQWNPASPTAGNYYRTELAYDDRGRLKRVLSPTLTITRTVYDSPGRVSSTWIGTDDVPTSGFWSPTNLAGTNTVKVTENEYDAGGIGDSNLTKSTQFPDGGTDPRVTAFSYDWRNRRVATKAGVEGSESTSLNRPIFYAEYDNLGQVIAQEQYDGDTISITTDGNSDGVPDRPSSSLLRAKSTAEYDEQGRMFRSHVFGVDPSSGTVSNYSLDSDTWFSRRGQVVKTSAPGGLVTKTAYDGAGRATFRYTTDGGGDSGWSDAFTVTGDAVLEQVETGYDAAGNVLLATMRQRFHDESGTGALGTPSTGVKARVSFVGYWYDKANRPTDTVNVGTYGGSAWTRPGSPPSRSNIELVTSTIYDDAGRAWKQTDPRGIESRTSYDMMGRTTKTIENYQNGTPSDTDDKTTDFAYFGPRLLFTLTAQMTSGSQETKYIYGVSSGDGSKIASNDLLRETRWPDKSTGAASSGEAEYSSYNALGQRIKFTDRNDNVHEFSFDVVSRPVADAVTTLGGGVDGAVRRHETAYDSAGRAFQFTSYDAATSGSIVNQVQRAFNGLGQIITEWQAHGGAVNTGTSPKVQYTYSEMPGGANHSRLTSLIYPDGFTVGYNYASGLDNTISRLTSMTNSSTTLEGFAYLGLGTVVERAHPEPGVKLTYIGASAGEAGDKYVGLDRFGRIIDQRWTDGSIDIDRYKYGYDRNSNRLYRTNELNHNFDELYHANGPANGYDGLNQLSDFRRGVLSDTNSDGIPDTVTTATRTQVWDPDALGNFEGVNTNGTNQARTHNKQNQSTVVGGNNLAFDDNGNMTVDEAGRTLQWDAWNRLVDVSEINEETVVTLAQYRVDALGRRIATSDGETWTDLYYSTNWQVLEERISGTPKARYVWSPVYIDAMVLRDRDADGNSGNGLEQRHYVTHDANFNVTALLSASGKTQERFVQDPYGRFDVKSDVWSDLSNSAYAWIYVHQGGRWDEGAGLFHFRNRDYSPTLMRWVSVDPIGFRARDVNFYRYENNNSIAMLDPKGLKAYLRCGPVATIPTPWGPVRGDHCTLFVECDGSFLQIDGGGIAPDPQNPVPTIRLPDKPGTPPARNPDDREHPLEYPFCFCETFIECLKKAFKDVQPQKPYNVLGPNSNTFLKAVLKRCGVELSDPPPTAVGWDNPSYDTPPKK